MKSNAPFSPAAVLEHLADDANILLAATAGEVEEHVVEARQRLASALASSQTTWNRVRQRCNDSAKATDRTIRRHPYESMAIALSVGAVIGFLARRR